MSPYFPPATPSGPSTATTDATIASLIGSPLTKAALSATYAPRDPNVLASGEIIPKRDTWSADYRGPVAGMMALAYFSARTTETINSLSVYTGITAGVGITLARLGIYAIDSAGAGTLVASTANDPTLFGATYTEYNRALTTPWSKVAGQRYATALLYVGATTAPNFHGIQYAGTGIVASILGLDPVLTQRMTGLTNLPATFAKAALGGSLQYILAMRLVP